MISALEGAPRPALGMIDLLLRDREAMLARIRKGNDVAAIMRTMIATIAVCMAIVGAALGSYRGGVQIAYAAIKLPIADSAGADSDRRSARRSGGARGCRRTWRS